MNALSPDEQDALDMARLAQGHDAALNDLMERHGTKLFHYLIRCLQNEDDAGDLAQETFVRVYQHRTSFRPAGKFSTWLYTIATNLVKTRRRFRARHPEVSLDAESAEAGQSFKEKIPAHDPTPSDYAQAEERARVVRDAVARLPEDLRTPLVLAEYEDLSQAQISEILGCSAKAVEMRIYRARQQLRASLSKFLEPA